MRQILLACALLGCSGCDQVTGKVSVQYIVNGSATRASMTYAVENDGTAQAGDRFLPWTHSWTGKKGDFVYLSAQNSGASGCINVEIRVRGDSYRTTQSCGGFVIATASGSIE